jgi:hypothetical protein
MQAQPKGESTVRSARSLVLTDSVPVPEVQWKLKDTNYMQHTRLVPEKLNHSDDWKDVCSLIGIGMSEEHSMLNLKTLLTCIQVHITCIDITSWRDTFKLCSHNLPHKPAIRIPWKCSQCSKSVKGFIYQTKQVVSRHKIKYGELVQAHRKLE